MTDRLIETFGYCIMPKNTILFRGHEDDRYSDVMFFGTKHVVAMAFSKNNIQVWKTTKELQILFLVEYLTGRNSIRT